MLFRRVCGVAFLLLAASCATPYQRMGFRGGYKEKQVDNGDWLITVKVNGFTERGTALEYLHRRADELCPAGYTILDRSDGDNGGIVVTRSYVTETHKPEVNALVSCAAPPARVAELAPRSVESLADATIFYCSSSPKEGGPGFCTAEPRACGDKRRQVVDSGIQLGPCSEGHAAVCFTYQTPDGGRYACGLTSAQCASLKTTVMKHPTNTNVGDCTGHGNAASASSVAATVAPPGDTKFFCTTSSSAPTVGLCARDAAACASARASLSDAAGDLTECTARAHAECFDFDAPEDGTHRIVCAPSSTTCGAQRDAARAKLGDNASIGPCADN